MSEGHLRLLGRFDLCLAGRPVALSPGGQRLVALVALHGATTRERVLARLWPDTDLSSAQHRVRSDLWRLQRRAPGVVEAAGDVLRLASHIVVDVRRLDHRARRVLALHRLRHAGPLAGPPDAGPPVPRSPAPDEDELLDGLGEWTGEYELLPGWDHEWLLAERQRLRLLYLHALETAAERLLEQHRHGEALDAALRAAAVEPLRESAHSIALRVHLAENNIAEASRLYLAFARRTREELGVAPSPHMRRLVAAVLETDIPAPRVPDHPAVRRIRPGTRSST